MKQEEIEMKRLDTTSDTGQNSGRICNVVCIICYVLVRTCPCVECIPNQAIRFELRSNSASHKKIKLVDRREYREMN